MGIRDWFGRGGQKAPREVMQQILNLTAVRASDAALAAINEGLSDHAVVDATVRVAYNEICGSYLSDADEDALADLADAPQDVRKAVLSVVKTALQTSSARGELPASRTDALQAALDWYARRLSQLTIERGF